MGGAALGGIIGAIGQVYAAERQAEASERASKRGQKIADSNRLFQETFAKHGIEWRVADAIEAGVHPLYALGANIPAYNPSPIPAFSSDVGSDHISAAGQNVSRAIVAAMSGEARHKRRMNQINAERGELENELLKSEIAKEKAQVGPPLPSAVPGTFPTSDIQEFDVRPVQIPATQPGLPNQEGGAFPETRWARTRTGFQPIPSPEAYEDADIGNPSAWGWYWRNQALPTMGISGSPPPDRWLPTAANGWVWSPGRQEWQPHFGKPDLMDRNFYFVPRKERRN